MRVAMLVTLVLTLTTISALPALAWEECGTPYKDPDQPGLVFQDVKLDWSPTEVRLVRVVGEVKPTIGTCGVGVSECTWGVQGTPGGELPQGAHILFSDGYGKTVDCCITGDDGLPVELIEFSVE